MNIEGSSFSTTLCVLITLLCLVLVAVDKKIKFHKVIGMEHMLRMKKFSNSEHIFKLSLLISITIVGLIMGIFKAVYTEAHPSKESVSLNV